MKSLIDVTNIISVKSAKEAIKTWKISEDTAKYIAQAFAETKKSEKNSSPLKERLEKNPELETENFRINSAEWKEIKTANGVRAKRNPEWDVREYLEGKYTWEQLFTYAAATREVNKAGKKIPTSWEIYEKIIKKKYGWDYHKFLEWEHMKFFGRCEPTYPETFKYIDREFGMWCEDFPFYGARNTRGRNDLNRHYGFAVRCIKE